MLSDSIPQLAAPDQIQTIAPTVFDLLNRSVARVTSAITSGDVVNGYGKRFLYYLKLEILLKQCRNCGETQFSRPRFDCKWHNLADHRFMQIADAEGSTLEKALQKLEAAIAIRERMVA